MKQNKKYDIKDFLEVKSAGSPSFSPDASRIIYLSNATGLSQIYIIERNGDNPIALTNSEDPVSFASFSPTEERIIFGKSEGGNEKTQLYLLDPNTKEVTPLTDNKNAKHDFGSWSRDGNFISYSSTERNGKDFDVYVMDIKTRDKHCVHKEGGMCHAGPFSPSGTYLFIKKSHSNTNTDIYLYNLKTKKIECLAPHTEPVFHGYPRWLADESALLFTTDKDREFIGLAKYSLDKKSFEYVFTPEWDIWGVSMQKDSKFIAIAVNEDGYNKVIIKDPHTFETLPYELPKGEISNISFSKDAKYMTFSLGDSKKTSDVWLLEMGSKECIKITNSHQGVPSELMVEPEIFRYKSFDGLTIPAFIYRPKNTENKKLPVVINIHGGPEGQYRPGYAPITQYLVSNGYVVVAPNIRGSAGYGKKYLTLDDVEKRMDSVKDIVALKEYLSGLSDIDSGKIVLMGGSYGGFMVLACLAFYPDLWAGGIDTVGIANFVTFLENTSPYRRGIREAEYGSLEKDRKFLESISPINSVDKIKAPLFIIHGANDPRVPLSEAEQMVSRLKELDREVELLVYQDEGHGLSKLKNKLDAYPKVVAFLDRIIGV